MRIPNATTAKTNGAQATPEETFATLRSSGCELTDSELEQISGGASWHDPKPKCPKCCSDDIEEALDMRTGKQRRRCRSCGRTW